MRYLNRYFIWDISIESKYPLSNLTRYNYQGILLNGYAKHRRMTDFCLLLCSHETFWPSKRSAHADCKLRLLFSGFRVLNIAVKEKGLTMFNALPPATYLDQDSFFRLEEWEGVFGWVGAGGIISLGVISLWCKANDFTFVSLWINGKLSNNVKVSNDKFYI